MPGLPDIKVSLPDVDRRIDLYRQKNREANQKMSTISNQPAVVRYDDYPLSEGVVN